MKKNGSIQVLYGFLIVLFVYFLGLVFHLSMVTGLLNSIRNLWILILLILFQQEIRDQLSKLNLSTELFHKARSSQIRDFNSSLIDAISAMSFRRIGAIIVIENKHKLNEYINAGEILDSVLSLRLILAIFNTKSVLHDGAIIIRDNRIIAAKVVLPLSKNIEYKQKFGTRHLAAIGISEISDAMAIVVSEQTGRVSLAVNGNIRTDVAFEELMQIITDATK